MRFYRGLLISAPFSAVLWLAVLLALTGCVTMNDAPMRGWQPKGDHDFACHIRSPETIQAMWSNFPGLPASKRRKRVGGFTDFTTYSVWIARDSLGVFAHEVRHIEEGSWHD